MWYLYLVLYIGRENFWPVYEIFVSETEKLFAHHYLVQSIRVLLVAKEREWKTFEIGGRRIYTPKVIKSYDKGGKVGFWILERDMKKEKKNPFVYDNCCLKKISFPCFPQSRCMVILYLRQVLGRTDQTDLTLARCLFKTSTTLHMMNEIIGKIQIMWTWIKTDK